MQCGTDFTGVTSDRALAVLTQTPHLECALIKQRHLELRRVPCTFELEKPNVDQLVCGLERCVEIQPPDGGKITCRLKALFIFELLHTLSKLRVFRAEGLFEADARNLWQRALEGGRFK